ncbi:Calcineurin-like phosphoesterase [Parapedobacter luteus]|uniref:Calcineurin-like phosphoesterase n=1 Tax=Parapedobacter luteus TaxID=623280 RepID=A0A1T5C4S4_9SPHI|nr:Calcineurin-like phosphoesterase [Parapedobacter luteus]
MKDRFFLMLLAVFILLPGFSLPSFEDEEGAFSIAVLPDTQFYTAEVHGGKKEMFFAQTEWIRNNQKSENIQYVVHLGDIVNYGEQDTLAWQYAAQALYALEDPLPGMPHGIPYGTAVGNHDQSPGQRALSDRTTSFNRYFGVDHFRGKPWYGGHYRQDNDSHYDLFSAGGMDFVVVYVEYDMLDEDQENMNDWAADVLKEHADRKAIVVSHAVVGNNRKAGTNEKGFAEFSKQGARLYDRLKRCPNLFLMLGGHVGQNGEGYRQECYAGQMVKIMLSDYQGRENGGNGLMRLLTFHPKKDRIAVRTFSPYSSQEETDEDSHFTKPLFMNTNAGRQFDFDNDGRSDITTFDAGVWSGPEGQVALGQAGDIPVPADYTGDGQTDRAVFRPDAGIFIIEGKDTVHFGQQGDIPVPGDYDGDGYADIAVFRPAVGTWYIQGLEPVKFGGPRSIPVPGDYDGDGKMDVAVFNPQRSVLQIYMMGNQRFEGYAADELIPVPADYNVDGRTDIAAFHAHSGEWIIYNVGKEIVRLGQPGDVPIPGNYHPSGKAVPAVLRNGKVVLADGGQLAHPKIAGGEVVNIPPAIRMTILKQ